MGVFVFIGKLMVYLVGLLVIALGINVSNLAGLGISPVSSIPKVLSNKFPEVTLGDMVIVDYIILGIFQFIILNKNFKLKNILGVPIAIIFGKMVDFVGIKAAIHPLSFTIGGITFGSDWQIDGFLVNFPRPENIGMSLLYLIASIVIIGIGVYIYLLPKFVPMPAEGLAGAISEISGKKFGNCKTIVDMSLIVIACTLQIIFFGIETLGTGFIEIRPEYVGVGIGTILSAFSVGQVVKFLAALFSNNFAKKNDDAAQ